MVENIKIKLEELKETLTEEQQRFLHFKSIDNFLFHFDNLSYQSQIAVKRLLQQYFDILDGEDYSIDKETSTQLGKEYIWQMGHYYVFHMNFKIRMRLFFAIFVGLHLDILLLILGGLKQVYYIPIVTCMFLTYWIYLKIFFENKKKVYAIRY